jgi:hypothetical protein
MFRPPPQLLLMAAEVRLRVELVDLRNLLFYSFPQRSGAQGDRAPGRPRR